MRGSISEKRYITTVAIRVLCAVCCTVRWAHLSGPNVLCIRTPWSIKGGRPLEENSGGVRAKTRQRIGSYTTKNNTSPSGCRVLRFGGPNHFKSCVLVSFLPKLDQPNCQSTSPSPPSLGIGGCTPLPGCGYPRNPATLLFLYLTNEVEFGHDILQDCISSYNLHV